MENFNLTGGRCPHCGGTEIAAGLQVNQNAEVGTIGLAYKAAKIFVGTEPLRADLCLNCGTVARLFVIETKHQWIQPKK